MRDWQYKFISKGNFASARILSHHTSAFYTVTGSLTHMECRRLCTSGVTCTDRWWSLVHIKCTLGTSEDDHMDSHLWGWHGDVGILGKSGRRHVHKRPSRSFYTLYRCLFHSFPPQVDLAKRLSHWVLHSPLGNKKYELLCIKNQKYVKT